MSTEPVKILSASVQEVFKLIEIKAKEHCNNIENFSVLENEFVQLSFLLGEVVERALNIIDTKTITLYRSTSKGNREIFEITGTNSECYKFFPNINFCPCKAFKHQVLKQKEFMCKHVLAAKIASILNKITIVDKKEEHFNYLIKQIKF